MVLSLDNIYLLNPAQSPVLGIMPGLKLHSRSNSHPLLPGTWREGRQGRDVCFFPFLEVHTIANYVVCRNDLTVLLNTTTCQGKRTPSWLAHQGSTPVSLKMKQG